MTVERNAIFDIDREKTLLSAKDPKQFEAQPILMLQAIRVSAEENLDLSKSLYEAILEEASLLSTVDPVEIREEFKGILAAEHAGKGLKLLAGADLMPHIIGKEIAEKMNRRELERFATLTENIDKTKPVVLRRLGLFYICFEKDRGISAAKQLLFDNETIQHIADAVLLLEPMHFIATAYEYKRFMASCGRERYEYLEGLAKAQRIVYDHSEVKIMNRHHLMKQITGAGEAIFVEDLEISEEDLVSSGIVAPEKAADLMVMLLDAVHINPRQNTKQTLLKLAKSYSRNKLKAAFRGVKWLK